MNWHWPQYYVAIVLGFFIVQIICSMASSRLERLLTVIIGAISYGGIIVALHVGGFW